MIRRLFLVLALFAIVILTGWTFWRLEAPVESPVGTVQQQAIAHVPMVVGASEEITTGELIKASSLKFIAAPTNGAADDYFERKYAANPGDQDAADRALLDSIAGSVARHHFIAGQALTHEAVVKPGDSSFLAAVLQPGMRAITIGITAVSGTGGLIYPGDRVDLILTENLAGQQYATPQHSFVAEIVATNIRVLAIDQELQAAASKSGGGKLAQTVTLEVTPRQAAEIAVAGRLGELSLTIRSLQAAASDPYPTGPIFSQDVSPALDALKNPNPPPPPPPPTPSILIMRGADSQTLKLQ